MVEQVERLMVGAGCAQLLPGGNVVIDDGGTGDVVEPVAYSKEWSASDLTLGSAWALAWARPLGALVMVGTIMETPSGLAARFPFDEPMPLLLDDATVTLLGPVVGPVPSMGDTSECAGPGSGAPR